MKYFLKRLPFLLTFTILIVAFIVRVDNITQPLIDPFSWGEAHTAMIAENFYRLNSNPFYPQVSLGGIIPNYQARDLPIVGYLSSLIYLFTDQQDWVGRAVAIVFGLWGVFAFYNLVLNVWDRQHAILGAALLALLPGAIAVDRSFLPDPAMVALVSTSLWMLALYLKQGRELFLILFGITGFLGVATKLVGIICLLPVSYVTISVLRHKRDINQSTLKLDHNHQQNYNPFALVAFTIFIIQAAFLYQLWARYIASSKPGNYLIGAENWIWHDGFNIWFSQQYFIPQLWNILINQFWSLPILVLMLLGLVLPYKQITQKGDTPYSQTVIQWIFHWWLLGGMLYYAVGAKELVNHPWSLHVLSPIVAALSARGIIAVLAYWSSMLKLPSSASTVAVIPISLILICLLSFSNKPALASLYLPQARSSYEMGLKLKSMTAPEDLLVTLGHVMDDPTAIYYSQRRGWTFPSVNTGRVWNQFPDNEQDAIKAFNNLQIQGAGWLAIAGERKQDFWTHHLALVEHINKTCHFEYKDNESELVIYSIPPASDPQKAVNNEFYF
ncbi:hypothetical protein Lepto7375DRAFT_1205 [Leptolyngbya sp. PCC 7375]|nr:hypothetical protein Lepto7375DRAFT_1205 [Leptolyngbya sp. PCC 7375]